MKGGIPSVVGQSLSYILIHDNSHLFGDLEDISIFALLI